MAGPGGREVARVSVRVVPNTDGFDEKLDAFLKKIERTAKVKVGVELDDKPLKDLPRRVPPLKPPVEPNSKPADREFATLKKKLDSLFGRIALDADPSKALSEFDRLLARAKELDPTLEIDADTEKALARARSLVAQIERDRPEIRPDTAPLDRELDVVKKKLDGLFSKITLDADPSKALSEFDRLLARAKELDPTVEVDADTAKALGRARSLVQEIDGTKTKIDLDLSTAPATAEAELFQKKIAALAAKMTLDADPTKALAEIDRVIARARLADVTINVDADTAAAITKIRALKAAGSFDVDGGGGGKLGALAGVFTSLLSTGGKLPGVLGSIVGGLGGVVDSGTQAFGASTKLLGSFSGMGKVGVGAASGILAVGVAIVAVLAKMVGFGAQASIVAAVLGAVTFAVGAAGAALSSLPALLFGVGLAGAAAFLGLDGIKKAAGAAKPALDALKTQVSAVFERGLTPAFTQLGKVLPLLRSGFEFVADGVAKMISQLLGVFTSTEGVKALNIVLGNARILIDAMTPGVVTLVRTLLDIATVTPVFEQIGLLVGELSLSLASLFARFAEGGDSSLMVTAFTELRHVLIAAVDAFGELLLGATEFFTAAGPGVTAFFESLQSVIAKIDFAGLGESFGIFASAVGTFFDSIPQSTWDQLADSLRKVAVAFFDMANNPDVQTFFSTLIGIIPTCVSMFADVLRAVSAFATAAIDAFLRAKLGVLEFALGVVTALTNAAGSIAIFLSAVPGIPQGMRDAAAGATTALGGLEVSIGGQLDATRAAIDARAPGFGEAGTGLGTAANLGAKGGIDPMPGDMGRIGFDAANRVAGAAGASKAGGQQVGDGARTGAVAGITPMPGQVSAIVGRGQTSVSGQAPGYRGAGGQLASGVEGGIAGGASRVIAAAVDIARRALAAAKRFLGIASPSKVFRWVGSMITRGWTAGLDGGSRMVTAATSRITGQVAAVGRDAIKATSFYSTGRTLGEQLGDGVARGVAVAAPAAVGEIERVRAGIADGAAAFDLATAAASSAGTSPKPGLTVENLIEALESVAWQLDPEGVARLQRKGEQILGRR